RGGRRRPGRVPPGRARRRPARGAVQRPGPGDAAGRDPGPPAPAAGPRRARTAPRPGRPALAGRPAGRREGRRSRGPDRHPPRRPGHRGRGPGPASARRRTHRRRHPRRGPRRCRRLNRPSPTPYRPTRPRPPPSPPPPPRVLCAAGPALVAHHLLALQAKARDALWRGPVTVPAPAVAWLMPLPIDRARLLRPRYRISAVAAGLLGAAVGAIEALVLA